MKTKLLMMFMILLVSDIFSQTTNNKAKWRSTEMDTLTVAQTMFDDQNFVMALPYLSELQKNHPKEGFLKYMTGICCLFKEDRQKDGLAYLLEIYKDNKRAEDIEFYLALAYHYNDKFVEAVIMADKYLDRKKLTKPQRRSAEKLIEYCKMGQKMVPSADEGKLDDYLIAYEEPK